MKVLEIFERELTSKDRRIEQLEDELLYLRKEQKKSDLDRDKLKKENVMLRKDLFELSKEYTNGK